MDLLSAIAIVLLLVLVTWFALVALIWHNRPPLEHVLPVLPLVPDLVSLVRGVRSDPTTPGRSRLALGALLLYLRSPIDLLPDLLPGIGSVDDLILAGVVLRRQAGRVGTDALRSHWPGSDEGFELLSRLVRI